MRRAVAVGAVAGSYLLLVGLLVLIVVALTAAVADGWELRESAARQADSSPRFSPDGTLIAFVRDGDGPAELWVMEDDGTDPRPLARAVRFAWTKRGSLLLSRGGRRLFRVDAFGGVPAGAGRGPLPRRAGSEASRRRHVFVRDRRVYVRAPDGSVHELT